MAYTLGEDTETRIILLIHAWYIQMEILLHQLSI